MKVNLNAIGFTSIKHIRVGEGLIITGVVLSTIGIISLIRSQSWIVGNTEEHLKAFSEVYNTFHT